MIIRAPRPTSAFYILDRRISEDRRLSWAARGLLICFRVHLLDDFIRLLEEEREILNQRNAGGA
ncbi:hypothetical protein [Burkholderia stagnalis]|uniref:hypothetical protein n=1 Tax=Burkholderia stagnalis TaxID=1503054 RepID=UPI000F5D904F|nr:hypothetical protein [Burkholderia stagnalis]RQY86714.1 hypothetical protein DF108_11015 [Burkholderia stagnalis]